MRTQKAKQGLPCFAFFYPKAVIRNVSAYSTKTDPFTWYFPNLSVYRMM